MEPFMLHWECTISGCKGELIACGVINEGGWDVLYRHICSVCGQEEFLKNEKYPRVEFFTPGWAKDDIGNMILGKRGFGMS